MKLCASNIAWKAEDDERVYRLMRESGFEGLEVAASRIFPERTYDHLDEAKDFARNLRKNWGLAAASMQSLWYGMPQKIAASPQERRELMACTVKAVKFADAMDCRNIVFGCPKNRNITKPGDLPIVEEFIASMADEAAKFGVTIALEPNPAIYGTNFITTTPEAAAFAERTGNPALKVNLDFGTVIANSESIAAITEALPFVNHVHISEPELLPIKPRAEHEELSHVLREGGYDGFVSIEMRKREGIAELGEAIDYVGRIFQ